MQANQIPYKTAAFDRGEDYYQYEEYEPTWEYTECTY